MQQTQQNRKNQGMNWIRQEKRLAIYLRDGMACVWCGVSVEEEVILSLDHLKPSSKGGSNKETNLVTSCHRCNSSRGSRPWKKFAEAVAIYTNHGRTVDSVINFVEMTRRRLLDIPAAKVLIAKRKTAVKVPQN
jgi:hypothetical protein